jgi:hypothetical protein
VLTPVLLIFLSVRFIRIEGLEQPCSFPFGPFWMGKTPAPRISNWTWVVFAVFGCLAGFALATAVIGDEAPKGTLLLTRPAARAVALPAFVLLGGAVPRPPQRPSFRLPPAALPSLPILSAPEPLARPEARRDASAPPSPHLRPTAAFTVTNSVEHMTPLPTRRAAVFRSMGLAVATVVLGITSAVAVAAPFSGPDTVDPMSEMTKCMPSHRAAEVITTAVPPLSASSLDTSKKAGEAVVEVSRAATEAKETVVSVGRAVRTALADASCERRRSWPHIRFFLNIASFTLGVCVVVLVKILLHLPFSMTPSCSYRTLALFSQPHVPAEIIIAPLRSLSSVFF